MNILQFANDNPWTAGIFLVIICVTLASIVDDVASVFKGRK
jgi:hypothetical protein